MLNDGMKRSLKIIIVSGHFKRDYQSATEIVAQQ
jgi:hypothetical protein